MAPEAEVRPSERLIAIVAVILLHALAFAVLLYQRWPADARVPKGGSLTIVALNAEPVAPAVRPPTPILRAKLQELVEAEANPEPAAATTANAVGIPGAGCATLEVVRSSILADPAAVTSVLNSPPEIRSIAEAVILWNAQWSESAGSLAAPLGATRAAVERSLATLDENCLDEPIAGPRLIPVPAGTGTMFVVMGSGVWTWREVTAEPPLPQQRISVGYVGPADKPPAQALTTRNLI
jgi:hypothetical protein